MTEEPQFIVAADPLLLQQIIDDLAPDPEVQILNVSGPAGAPERIVARMAPARAEALRSTFGEQVTVEPDEPLTLYP
jgi:hypothetical protein